MSRRKEDKRAEGADEEEECIMIDISITSAMIPITLVEPGMPKMAFMRPLSSAAGSPAYRLIEGG